LCDAQANMASETSAAPCLTCYGTGEVVTESGPVACPDCYGNGRSLGRSTTVEWRLRDVERAHRRSRCENEPDVLCLVHELRRSREALMRIVARCEDAGGSDDTVLEVKHLANEVLGLYEPKP
jgi:hypothetical protein